jgi:hypothetical protein
VPLKTLEDRVAFLDVQKQDSLELVGREKALVDVAVAGPPVDADTWGILARAHKFGRDQRGGVDFVPMAIITRIICTSNNLAEQAKIRLEPSEDK